MTDRVFGKSCLGLFLLLLVTIVCGCGGGGGGSDSGLTREQKAMIEQSSNNISERLASSADPGSESALQDAKTFAETMTNVESATVQDGNLVVKYKKAGQEIWIGDTSLPTPPADLSDIHDRIRSVTSGVSRTRAPLGNLNAVLINALDQDPAFASAKTAFSSIEQALTAAGFTVRRLNGPDVNLDTLGNLNDSSLVVMLGHGGCGVSTAGGPDTNPYCVQTGVEWDWTTCGYEDWTKARISKINVGWGTGEQRKTDTKSFIAVTGKYWTDAYTGKPFSNALFMDLSCAGAKNQFYRQALFGVGVGSYTGWTEEQGRALYSAWYTLALMVEGKSLQEAVDGLPDWYKSQSGQNGTTAILWVGPDTSITLGGTVPQDRSVVISSPPDGSFLLNRRCNVEGTITPWSPDVPAQIIVNGQSSALTVVTGGRFSHPVALVPGANTVRVTTVGTGNNSAEATINYEFNGDVIRTELSWSTDKSDLDIHLAPIDDVGGFGECYYNNPTPSLGASLDLDDEDGFGPELITAKSIQPGKYKLYVHYFDSKGQTTPAEVTVSVSIYGDDPKVFSLGGDRAMRRAGDFWDVCEIDFPSGEITVLDKFVQSGRSSRAMRFPPK